MPNAHTPGPWKVRYAKNLTALVTPRGEMQLSLHGVYDGLDPLSVDLHEWKANARLIAQAPRMLEALTFLCDLIDNGHEPLPGCDAVKEARAILRAVKGE